MVLYVFNSLIRFSVYAYISKCSTRKCSTRKYENNMTLKEKGKKGKDKAEIRSKKMNALEYACIQTLVQNLVKRKISVLCIYICRTDHCDLMVRTGLLPISR